MSQKNNYFLCLCILNWTIHEYVLQLFEEVDAGLDVVDPEPLPPDHPLWKSPRILFTPHISPRSDLPREARSTVPVQNLRRYVAGDKLLNVVDLARGF